METRGFYTLIDMAAQQRGSQSPARAAGNDLEWKSAFALVIQIA